MRSIDDYKDIMDLPRPSVLKHPRMSRINRAAQFAPFSALTGYERAIEETARKARDRMEQGYSSAEDSSAASEPASSDTILP